MSKQNDIVESKKNSELGKAVRAHLIKVGIETPLTDKVDALSDDEKISIIEEHMKGILETLGMDLTDDSLSETPHRVAKMYVKEIFSGLQTNTFPKCTTVENKFCHGDEFVLEQNITLFSDCEHHIRPIIGHVHVAYIPKKKVLGLSKLNRIVQYFGKRLSVQERLTHQIAEALSFIVESDDVIVMVDAKHTCVSQRGVQDTDSTTKTLAAKGVFAEHNSELRKEFLSNF